MASLILFVFFILGSLLNLLKWAVIISAIISWLVAFDVINLRNRAVYSISRFLDAVTAPLLAPLRRVIPPLGGVDITPIILFLIIVGVQSFLLYPLRGALLSLLG
ncbi:YggT family protein [Caulobacter sp. D4A]|uniref:YggT family protein n=1 Tax=unclassified Caulobacter TaxID=2648921 RepID=UPI000D72B23A|nr:MULTISPECIES: YggT family protein [unclassified Caulobacter]PXA95298.1 YggT family protein [Caulobacter sp. D4A]PXA95609.1 YggT family protein [Caulobacter sp. D5]